MIVPLDCPNLYARIRDRVLRLDVEDRAEFEYAEQSRSQKREAMRGVVYVKRTRFLDV
jgi:hypothetical protein